jgi:hypothetical protein
LVVSSPLHEDVVIRYLADQLHSQADWRLATEAFTLLDSATFAMVGNTVSLRRFYQYFGKERILRRQGKR